MAHPIAIQRHVRVSVSVCLCGACGGFGGGGEAEADLLLFSLQKLNSSVILN